MRGNFQEEGQVGDYTLLRRLASGGMGEIWLAERKGISGFSKRVVIKTILECFADEPSLVDMFLDEGRIAANLNHPNIAQTYDLGEVGRTYYIAMEYIKGRDLRNLLLTNVERGQLLPLNLVLRILAETCEGLYYAHNWKTPDGRPGRIIHRDISPQNILVTFDGKVKIIDFGIAKAAQSASQTRSGVLKGKYAYMSPEQVRGKVIDHRSDLFSLGVVMYELVTARRLFKRESELSTLDAVLRSDVPPVTRFDRGVPEEVEAVLHKALAREPEERFQDARAMQLALEEIMLTAKMPASSAHMAAYMEELFSQDLEQEREQEQESLSLLDRKMESLPGVSEAAPKLERTMPFAPGMSLDRSTESRRRELTRNLMPSQMSSAPARPGSSPVWKWALVGLLACVVGVGAWFLSSSILADGTADGGIAPEADGTAVVALLDAGLDEQGPAADGPAVDAGADGGALAGADPTPEGLGLDLSDPVNAADRDQAADPEQVARLTTGRLQISTSATGEIYLNRKRVGRGSFNGKLRAGTYTVRVVAGPGASKTARVKVAVGRTTSKRISFENGKLRVVVMPWANVLVNGKKIGQTPMGAIELLEGDHQVVLTNPSLGKNVSRKVQIRPGQETLLRLDWR